MSDQPMEYLDAGGIAPAPASAPARRPRRWLPIVLGAAAFVVVLAALGAVVGDWTVRNLEMRAVVAWIEVSEAAMGDLQAEVTSIAAEYEGRVPLDEADQAEIDAALTAVAAEGLARVTDAGDGVAGVRWLLWHPEVGAAQDAYLAHNRAWQAYLERAAKDPSEFARAQDDINSTFADAEDDLRDALPAPALFDLVDRVSTIFAPAPLPEGQGQQA